MRGNKVQIGDFVRLTVKQDEHFNRSAIARKEEFDSVLIVVDVNTSEGLVNVLNFKTRKKTLWLLTSVEKI